MAPQDHQQLVGDAWALVQSQHGVITSAQLRGIGYTHEAVRHRVRTGRLFTLWRGVYAVGRPDVSLRGRWKAATLATGPDSALAGESGAALWGVRSNERHAIELAVPRDCGRALAGLRVRRVRDLSEHVTEIDGIPVVSLPFLFVGLGGACRRETLRLHSGKRT